MKNTYFSVKPGAKGSEFYGGGNSQGLSDQGTKYQGTSEKGLRDQVPSTNYRTTSVECTGNHPVITLLSPRNHPLLGSDGQVVTDRGEVLAERREVLADRRGVVAMMRQKCMMWKYVACLLLAFTLGVGNAWGTYSYNAATSVPAWTIQFNSWYGESDASTATAATVHNPRLNWNGSSYKNNNSTASAIAFDDGGFYYIYNHNEARELPTGDALSALCYVLFKDPGSYFKYNKSSGSFSVSSGGDEATVYGLTFNAAVATGVQLEIHAPQEGYVRMLIGTNTNTYQACTATLSGATTGTPSINSLAANASYGVKTKSEGSFSTTTYYSRGARQNT